MLLDVDNLHVSFGTRERPLRAVAGVSLAIPEGGTVALVGESGCGKSVTALALARLLDEPPARISGSIHFGGRDVLAMDARELRTLRGAEIAYVFQDPSTSLNPVYTVGQQIMESLRLHRADVDAKTEAVRLLEMVGIADAGTRVRAYPHELSGGQRQRVAIAMALACRPRLLVADEPTTALDVTVQAQILERIAALQREFGMAVLLITHNLGIVAGLAQQVYVMYAGRVVEAGPVKAVLRAPAHPYTRGLLDAVPQLPRGAAAAAPPVRLTGIPGRVPDLARMPAGCKFAPRCARRMEACEVEPELVTGHGGAVRCWRPLGPGR